MGKMRKSGRILTIFAVLFLVVMLIYKTEGIKYTVSEAAGSYPGSMIENMQPLLEEGYFLLDVSNMRQQEEGTGPTWSRGTELYYCNITTGSGWRSSVSSNSAGLSEEEKKIICKLRQSNIFCFKLEAADTDTLQLSYSNDNTENKQHYYKTSTYKAGDLKGKLYAYLAAYTAKNGNNAGKKAYLIGKVSIPVTPKASDANESEKEDAVEEVPVLADATSNNTVTIRVNHDFTDKGGAKILFNKENSNVSSTVIGTGIGSFVYDLESTTYDSFYIQQTDNAITANTTDTVSTETLKGKKEIYGGYITVSPSGYTGNLRRIIFEGTSIYIKHDFTKGATICYTKGGTKVSSKPIASDSIIAFDIKSAEYDGFYIEETGASKDSNRTVILSKDAVETALKSISDGDGMLKAVVGGYTNDDNVKRTLKLLESGSSISDMSLNIPEGTFTKEDNVLYVNSTFYDYYSDVEMEGTNRSTLTGNFNQNPGSEDKIQARKFNQAIEDYFSKTSLASSTWQSPLYFGEFTDAGVYTNTLLNFKWGNNNGAENSNQARLGLVNSKLVDNKLMMGTDNDGQGVEAPYFNKDFLRGKNSLKDNIGYVFENVQFPFTKNTDKTSDKYGYWEFNSYDENQTLRMKQTDGGKYFLDCVGASKGVHGSKADPVGPTDKTNFFPYNGPDESGNPKKLNYAFGARIEIPFYMTKDGKVKIDETTSNDITFDFQGDDDVWIFIDDTLILDIGGDHGAVKGSINFAKCKAETTGRRSATEYGTFTSSFTRLSSTEQHTLTLFYMERGIWESNMYISFNFPKTNNLSVEKEIVTDGINSMFADAVTNLKNNTSFPVTIENMATSGNPFDVTIESKPIQLDFDEITNETSAKLYQAVNGASVEKLTANNIPQNDTNTRNCVLKYQYPGEKKYTDGQSVTDARSILINLPDHATGFPLTTEDATRIQNDGYIECETYLDTGVGSGAPFMALIDGDGNRIAAWASEGAVSGTNAKMQAGQWVKIKIYISQMKPLYKLGTNTAGTFDYTNIKQLQFAYWDNKAVYIDNITLNAPAVYTDTSGFEKDQNQIPDYGSIGNTVSEYKLMPVNGAKYKLNGVDNYVNSGTFSLKNKESAIFSDQFRRNSYLSINEQCNTNVFDVAWTLEESGVLMKSGTGTAVEDKRTASNTDPVGIEKPDANTILFKTWDKEANSTKFFDLDVKFTNTVKTGSLKIRKQVLQNQEILADTQLPYTIRITFSNIAGLGLEGSTSEYDYLDTELYLESGKSEFEITGIPAGTDYRIEEVRTAGAGFPLQEEGKIRDDFSLSTMTSAGNDAEAGSYYDTAGQCYRGTIIADTSDEITDVVSVVNDINPKTTVSGEKKWTLGTENAHLGTAPEAESVSLKLQRKFTQTTEDVTNNVTYSFSDVTDKSTGNPVEITLNNQPGSTNVMCSDGNEITVEKDTGWKYGVSGLPLYGKTDAGRRRKYEYRLIEVKIKTKTGETVILRKDDDSGYKENNSGYVTTGGNKNVTVSSGAEVTDYNLTNEYNPLTNLEVTKVSGDETPKKMGGVTFRLERLINDSVDTNANGGKGYWEATTGEGTGVVTFLNLADGNYRLTEIKTVKGYSLLARPIEVVISRANGTTIEKTTYPLESDGKTIKVTISNQGLLELPFTGSNGRIYVICFGIALVAGGESLYLWNMYHQRKKRQKMRKACNRR